LFSVLLRRPEEVQPRVAAPRRPPRRHASLGLAWSQVHPRRSRIILRTGKLSHFELKKFSCVVPSTNLISGYTFLSLSKFLFLSVFSHQ